MRTSPLLEQAWKQSFDWILARPRTDGLHVARSPRELRSAPQAERQALIYVVHSGKMYGTERAALWTLDGLRRNWDPILIAPPGPVHEEAERLGIEVHPLRGRLHLLFSLWRLLVRKRKAAVLTTGVGQALLGCLAQLLALARVAHACVVHGGVDEHASFGRKAWLARTPVQLIAVSDFVRRCLCERGVRERQVRTIENFLPERAFALDPRPLRREPSERRLLVVSRLDAIKHVDLLIEALERSPDLHDLPVRVLGDGPERQRLEERVRRSRLAVEFVGYSDEVFAELDRADGLVHTWEREPFGLAVAEGQARGLPVLVPDAGGAAALVEHERTGLHYIAGDADSLAAALRDWRERPAAELEALGQRAWGSARMRYARHRCLAELDAFLVARLSAAGKAAGMAVEPGAAR